MTNSRWQQIQQLYHAALERPASARTEFLIEACNGDPTLLDEVQSLLDQPVSAEQFLEPGQSDANDHTPSVPVGQRLGVYQFQALIGRGGMGEVYRARDTKLSRDVAIKILPRAFTSDPERLARFEREARVLASLNHPHIASIYGVEESDDARALVLELVPGETLADRLARGPMPVVEALETARQIADALEAAHEKGIVHRDLKPGNVKITSDGVVKVLDFGLAKLEASGSSTDLTQSPTVTVGGTRGGVILGTAAYMSPEQARGKPVDKRTDIWAFGCVLFEMMTGRTAFAGETVTDTLAAIVEREPDWKALPTTTPANILRLLKRCVDKDLKRRLHDIADARLELEEADVPELAASRFIPQTRRREWITWTLGAAIAAVVGLLLAGTVALLWRRPASSAPQLTFEIAAPPGAELQFALSPLGTHVVAFIHTGNTVSLWLRRFDRLDGAVLPGTEGAWLPFWSPDGRFIGFFAGGKLQKVGITGTPPQTLADARDGRGGSWSTDNVIVFAPNSVGPLFRVSAEGGVPVPITELDATRQETGHGYPQMLPDGRHLIYLAHSSKPENTAIVFGSLDKKGGTPVALSPVKALFAPPTHLLFLRETSVMAQTFDPASGHLTGDPFAVGGPAGANIGLGTAGFSVSANGLLAFRSGPGAVVAPDTSLAWFDRSGRELGTVATIAPYRNPRLSPDGLHVIVERVNNPVGGLDLWLMDLARNVASRFTFTDQPLANESPVWSPDGTRVAWWTLEPATDSCVFLQKLATGIGKEDVIGKLKGGWVLDEWLPNGLLIHDGAHPPVAPGVQLLPLAGGAPRLLSDTKTLLTHARIAPGGQWIAFTSNDTGRFEVYIQNFPEPLQRIQVSAQGGIQPVWRPDGKELFFLASDGKLMAVPIQLENNPVVGTPVALFDTQLQGGGIQTNGIWHEYDVARDGKRFLLNTLVHPQQPQALAPITIVTNWETGVKK